MKPSKAACEVAGEIDALVYLKTGQHHCGLALQIARLIDEHVKGLIAATDALYDEYPWNDSISSAVVSAFKPWTEPVD